ncbi:MAG TPA: acyl-CoA dehydrogenase [Anaeromyxobacteraceae bacterium]|nr:acyl-CoA dehydrogenase [Anaeromyxobacteraceae bacterium]
MDLSFTPEQELLADQVRRFLADRYGFEARRAILRSKEGWSREVWAGLAEMGLLGLQIPEAHGGMGPAPVETLIGMTAFGRSLLLEPYLSSAVLASALLRDLGSGAQQAEWLPALAAGELVAAPAHGEPGTRHDLALVSATAARREGGWALTGHKAAALHAPAAGLLLATARTGGRPGEAAGISLFAVRAGAPGLSLLPYRTFDGHLAAEVRLAGAPAELVGPEGGAFPALEAAFDLGVAALCAEAVGAMQASLDATLEYVKARKQFGVPIGKFQALQHRLVDMLMHLEQARSMSYLAAMRAGSPDARERRRSVSAAKVVVGRACRFVGQQSVQLHGGMGVTDELMVSHHFRRLTAIELSLGDTEHHLERFVENA